MCTNGVGSHVHKLPSTSNVLFAVFGRAGDGESVAQGGGDIIGIYNGGNLFYGSCVDSNLNGIFCYIVRSQVCRDKLNFYIMYTSSCGNGINKLPMSCNNGTICCFSSTLDVCVGNSCGESNLNILSLSSYINRCGYSRGVILFSR